MTYRLISAALAALLVNVSLCFAVENTAIAPEDAASQAAPKSKSTPGSRAAIAAKRKAAAKMKTVNINAAKKVELMKLPGIGEAEADKIIAGRPYGSKTWLVTNNVLPEGVYMSIRTLIDAGAGPRNAELFGKKK